MHHVDSLATDNLFDFQIAEPWQIITVTKSDFIVLRAHQKVEARTQTFKLTFVKPDDDDDDDGGRNGGKGGKIAAAVLLPLLAVIVIAAVCYWRWRSQRGKQGSLQRHLDRPAQVAALISKLGVVNFSKASPLAGKEACGICHNSLEDSQTAHFLPNCGHAFHADCLRFMWLKPQDTLALRCFTCGVDAEPQQTLGGERSITKMGLQEPGQESHRANEEEGLGTRP